MIRKVFKFFFILLIIAMVAGGYYWTHRAYYIAQTLSHTMDTRVTLESFDIEDGQFILRGLKIPNPEKAAIETAFSSREIRIALAMSALRSETVTIDSISIDDPTLGIELYSLEGRENNWERILNKAHDKSRSTKSKPYHIRHLVIKNLQMYVHNNVDPNRSLTMPPIAKIEFKDIRSNDKNFQDKIVTAIADLIVREAIKQQGLQRLLDRVQKVPGIIINDTLKVIKSPGKLLPLLDKKDTK